MFAPKYITKQIMYAGLRPFLSEMLPMNVGARPWHTIYTVTSKISESAVVQMGKNQKSPRRLHEQKGSGKVGEFVLVKLMVLTVT